MTTMTPEEVDEMLEENHKLSVREDRMFGTVKQLVLQTVVLRSDNDILHKTIFDLKNKEVEAKQKLEGFQKEVHALQNALSNSEKSVTQHLAFCLFCALIAIFYAYRA